MTLLHSNVGLLLTAVPILVHGTEALFPMTARFVANLVMPFFGFRLPTDSAAYLTLDDQTKMLESAISAAPSDKWTTAADYIFILTFEQRQGSAGFWATLVGSLYAMTLLFSTPPCSRPLNGTGCFDDCWKRKSWWSAFFGIQSHGDYQRTQSWDYVCSLLGSQPLL